MTWFSRPRDKGPKALLAQESRQCANGLFGSNPGHCLGWDSDGLTGGYAGQCLSVNPPPFPRNISSATQDRGVAEVRFSGGPRMASYRFYCLDGSGHVTHADWIEAGTDDAAIAQIRAMKPAPSRCEIWQNKRLVAKIAGQRAERFRA